MDLSHPSPSCQGNSKPNRSRIDRLFDGTTVPSVKAYSDMFVHNSGSIDRNLVTFSNAEDDPETTIHRLFYIGEEVWRADAKTMATTMAERDENTYDMSQHSPSKRRFQSTCFLIQESQQLELTIESSLPSVASDKEVQDEIASAPTSVWCNTTNGCHEATLPTESGEVVIFRESRKLNVDNLIRASAEAYQHFSASASIPEREAKVVEYCIAGATKEENMPGVEATSDGSDDDDEKDSGRCSDKLIVIKRYLDDGAGAVVKSSVSMASDSSSVYLNQEDDELSAQQQEMVRAFGGVGCFVNVA